MRRTSVVFACVVAVLAMVMVSSGSAEARPAPRVTLHNVHPNITTKQHAKFTFKAFHLRSGSRVVLQEREGSAWIPISRTQKLSHRAKGWFRTTRPDNTGTEQFRVVVIRKGKVKAFSPTRTVHVR